MRFPGANDIRCKSCGHFETLPRPPRADDVCPACGAGVFRREGPAPDPLSHVGVLVRAMGSLGGVLFIVGVALIASVPHMTLRALAAVMITLASLKLAIRAMNVTRKDGIGFPEVSPEELFDRSALLPAGVFAIVFTLLPRLLFATAFAPSEGRLDDELVMQGAEPSLLDHDGAEEFPSLDDDETAWEDAFDEEPEDPALAQAIAAARKESARAEPPSGNSAPPTAAVALTRPPVVDDGARPRGLRVAVLLLALMLFLYAPMALVSYLRSGSAWALFNIPQGILDIAKDPRGYARLCAVAVTAFVVGFAFDTLTVDWPFYAAPLAHIPRNTVQLFAWGVCGLYVRSRARQLAMPVDDDDWVLLTRHAAPVASVAEPMRVRPTSISLDDVDDIPVVQGAALPDDRP